jgi:hypothetical protein
MQVSDELTATCRFAAANQPQLPTSIKMLEFVVNHDKQQQRNDKKAIMNEWSGEVVEYKVNEYKAIALTLSRRDKTSIGFRERCFFRC